MAAELITVQRARERVLQAVRPLSHESVPIAEGLDRVIGADLLASGDVPAFACSAMDGYAIADGPSGRTLKIVGQSRAGMPSTRECGEGEAIRISTGAAVPPGASAVVRQEDTEPREDAVYISAPVAAGQNIRAAGEDLRAGSIALAAGTKLGVAELGAAVAAGAGRLTVARRPRVAILCTGDELRAPGEPLGPGQIHNSNAAMLEAIAIRCGARAQPPQRLPDDRSATEQALAAALADADVVVVSGGVSVGPHDHVRPALAALDVPELFWGIALQPGKPTWFGARGDRLVFGLPGNPVSAVVTFALLVAPALAALQGQRRPSTRPQAELAVAVRRNPGREQALRVRLEYRDARTVAVPNGPQGSHLVSSLLGADALAVIPAGSGELETGSLVALAPLPR